MNIILTKWKVRIGKEMELGDQPPSQQWLHFEGLFPMDTMEQFNEFEKALKDPHVCIV